jgi:(2Fe-2S) ferredoxin
MVSCGRRHNTRKTAGVLERLLKRKKDQLNDSVTIIKSRCLGQCLSGPVLLVHPEGIYYSFQTQNDLDEIIAEHLVGGRPVERLKMAEDESPGEG